MERDAVYYRRRLAEEKSAAIHATHPKVRAVHLEMAAGYEQRLAALDAGEEKVALRLIDVA